MCQQPPDESGTGQHENQVRAISVPDHIGRVLDRFARRALGAYAQIADDFIDDGITDAGVFYGPG